MLLLARRHEPVLALLAAATFEILHEQRVLRLASLDRFARLAPFHQELIGFEAEFASGSSSAWQSTQCSSKIGAIFAAKSTGAVDSPKEDTGSATKASDAREKTAVE